MRCSLKKCVIIKQNDENVQKPVKNKWKLWKEYDK